MMQEDTSLGDKESPNIVIFSTLTTSLLKMEKLCRQICPDGGGGGGGGLPYKNDGVLVVPTRG